MHGTISSLVASYGYLFLFALVGVESFGIPLPGETALVTAAALAAMGRLDIFGVIGAAAAGAIVGDNAGYWVGREGGIALLHRHGRRVGLDEAKLARAHAFFVRHGAKTVFIGRFVALLRSWAAALAGVACMPYGRFMFYNAAGGIVWAVLFGALGYAFGRNLPRLERYVAQLSLALVLLVTLGVLLVLGVRWARRNGDRIVAGVASRWQQLALSSWLAGLRARHPRIWSFAVARFSSGEYLGLHLTIGFVASVAALWLFGGVTEDVIHHDPLTAIDVQLATWMRAHATPAGDHAGLVVSAIGSPVAMSVLALTVLIVLARRRWWIVLSGWVAAFVGGGALDWALKRVIQRPRPPGAAEFLYATSFSFPSGHTLGSLIGFGMLAYLLIAFWPPARRHGIAVLAGTLVLVLLIGLSRLYLGVHYLSDVIGGYAAGGVWLSACITGIEIALRQRGLSPWEAVRREAVA
ncbi:MAG TPA: bifunctional DedA family/phosphatase PAP2 family protein [Gemmatimonadaceae bacterium]|nr:bifunctional DedA family/phosphatase PAP2 family protein [Gemmatimonadaceae bacterium]